MHYNIDIIKIGEQLRGQYLYNIYNEAPTVKYLLTIHADKKNINKKILKLTT